MNHLTMISCVSSDAFWEAPMLMSMTAKLSWIVVWGVLESGLGIIAAAAATLRPLFKNICIPGFFNFVSLKSTSGKTRLPKQEEGLPTTEVSTSRPQWAYESTTMSKITGRPQSQECTMNHNGIEKTIEVDVSYEDSDVYPSELMYPLVEMKSSGGELDSTYWDSIYSSRTP